jgi:hypothetical protein
MLGGINKEEREKQEEKAKKQLKQSKKVSRKREKTCFEAFYVRDYTARLT